MVSFSATGWGTCYYFRGQWFLYSDISYPNDFGITQKVYENGQWSKQDLDLHGKLLIYVKSSPPMPAATEQINNGF